MGRLHRLAASRDSLRVLQGVGIGSVGPGGVFYTQINPVELEFWTPDGEKVWAARPTRGLAPLSDFANDEGLSPLIPYVTGVEVWEELVLLTAYSAAEDASSLWLFDSAGAEIASLEVPFEIHVRGHVGEIVAMERWIGRPELAGYPMEYGRKGRN